jgi:hypothetical protein
VWREVALRGRFKEEEWPALRDLGAGATLAGLQKRAQEPPVAEPSDWLYERHHWRAAGLGLLLAQKYFASPAAEERRLGLEVALWLAHSPFLRARAPHLPGLIADGLVLPHLGSASNDLTRTQSRGRLLWAVAEVYAGAGRLLDEASALRGVVAVTDPLSRNLADGARHKLALRLAARGRTSEAIPLLEAISHDGLKRGAQEILLQWRADSSQ